MNDALAPRNQLTADRGGKLVVLSIFLLAAALAAFAWWWNLNRGRRALEFYGPEAATLIRTAPKVEIVESSGQSIDISRTAGLLNARTSLLDDASYEWSPPLVHNGSSATTVVRFAQGEEAVSLAFDFDRGRISILPHERTERLAKKTAEGWRAFLSRRRQSGPTVPVGRELE